MMGLWDLMDDALATELGVDVETYIDVIENKCTAEEADFIITALWEEGSDPEPAKALFKSKL